jgi:triacylglycerol esterase/lipase EstA (alpha/beta hydrolase family)
MLAGLSPARRRFVLSVLALALAAALVLTVVVLRSTLADGVQPVAQDRPGPVLLIPGYGGSLQSLSVLARDLRAHGRDVSLVDLPGGGTGDLRQQAAAVARSVKAVLARTHAPSVDVIGYSAGGVVARLWVKDFGGAAEARRVLTLGSPHHGTDIAGIGAELAPSSCPTACQQLTVDSTLLRGLNAGDETPRGPAYVSIWTTDDQVVTPPASASLDGAVDVPIQSVCPGIHLAHGDLPGSPVVLAAIRLELAATPVVPLSAADCQRLRS